jgi:hypothetical protein
MVPVDRARYVEARAALRARGRESCHRDLSSAFSAWLLQDRDWCPRLAAIASSAASRQGGEQDFQATAILGFAAEAGLLSGAQIEKLTASISRLAGRKCSTSGTRMTFCCDPVGLLGVSLGTKAIADPALFDRVAQWATSFVGTSYVGDLVQDWQRCLFAVANTVLGSPLRLSMPNSAAVADVRTALRFRGLFEDDGHGAAEDATQALTLAVQQPPEQFTFEEATLRLAALRYVTGRRGPAMLRSLRFVGRKQARPARQRAGTSRVRRNPRYTAIDAALREIADSRPSTHEEVFEFLDVRRVPIPSAQPFLTSRGWVAGFRAKPAAAHSWISKRWKELSLPAMPRGPKKKTE